MDKNCNTNPLSTNQIVEVGIRKPRCFKFTGNTLNDWLKFIAEEFCCFLDNNNEAIEDITVNSNWTVDRTVKLYKKGSFIHLSGEVSGGDVGTSICTLPYVIASRRIVPVAHLFDPSADYNVFLKIDTDKSVKLYFTGTAPTGASPKLFLDGISFFIEES